MKELLLLIGALILGIIWYSYAGSNCNRRKCVEAHSINGLNYEWLNEKYGKVLKVSYEEPVGSGRWKEYDDSVWDIHCSVISHDPKNLAQSHISAFINPKTRFARLMFQFDKNGYKYQMEPNTEMYMLEEKYFRNNKKKLNCMRD